MSQVAHQLSDSCDTGPAWPAGCDPFGQVLSDGWPGYRTDGAYYVAALSLLSMSGEEVNEQVLLFRTPRSRGLAALADRARSCGSAAGTTISGATVHRLPVRGSQRRYVVIDATVGILLDAPAELDGNRLIRTALQRARS